MSWRFWKKIIPIPKSLHPHLDWWLEKRTQRSTVAFPRPRSTNVYRRLKRRLGRTLRGLYCKRHLIRDRKSPPYQFSRVKGSFSGPQELRASLQGPDCVSGNGQHNCGILYQQGEQYKIRLSVCPPLEASVLVPPQRDSPEGKTHPKSFECNSRQVVQTQTSDPDRVVPISAGIQSFVLQMGPTTAGPSCNPVQPQTPKVRVTRTGSNSLGSGRLEPPMGELGCLHLSTSLTTQQGSIQSD